MLWDTAGQEEFDAITKAYYRGAQACVIAFSTVDRVSKNSSKTFFDSYKKFKLTYLSMAYCFSKELHMLIN